MSYATQTTVPVEKSRLEIERILATFEEEFLAHFVVPGGGTFGELAIPKVEDAYRTGQMLDASLLQRSQECSTCMTVPIGNRRRVPFTWAERTGAGVCRIQNGAMINYREGPDGTRVGACVLTSARYTSGMRAVLPYVRREGFSRRPLARDGYGRRPPNNGSLTCLVGRSSASER
jgi:hypothetical protein